ncbi:MAG: response regulator transcription factor [Acidobacteriota bacterium]
MRVLIVEDHRDIAANIADFLEARGAEPDFAYDGLGGLHLALTNEYDAIVLDVMLPGMDGLDFARRLRGDAGSSTPILMLTARDTLADKLAGFEAGTDDYLVKPFDLQELAVRLDALVRRTRPSPRRRLRYADLELDPSTHSARRGGVELSLNRTSFLLLRTLLEAAPGVVARRDLERALWGDEPPDSDALRSHIYLLRRSVDRPFSGPDLLHTVHGVGYRLAGGDP